MAKKCTHPRGYDANGICPICRARKRGPKPKSAPRIARISPPRPSATTIPTAAPAVTTPAPALPAPAADAGRAQRMARLLPTPPQPEPAEVADPEPEPEVIEQEQAEPEKAELGYDWKWTAQKLVTGLDIVSGIAIDKFTDREPLDAGEDETQELVRVTADYGEKRIGKIEAPLWLVFLIALAFFVLSKYSGAPKKPQPVVAAKPKAEPATTTPSKGIPAAVDTADTSTPAAASDAATPETPHQIPPALAVIDGNVGGATVGY